MATRSDHLHSHQFVVQRAVGALAMRNADPLASPTRRMAGALIASMMIAVLGLAAAGVYGLLRPTGGDAWRDGSSLIIEKETGARYVFRAGVLYPVLNHSSALLILGTADPQVRHVPASALLGVTRGAPLGIPGAPDPLPPADAVIAAGWEICSTGSEPQSRLALGVPQPPPSLADGGLLVRDPAGTLHLIWHDRRYELLEPELVTATFGWSRSSATPMAPSVLNAIPPGTPLHRPAVPSGGASAVDGVALGDVVVTTTQGGRRQYGVALAAGLADITQVQADLLVAGGASLREVGVAQYAAMPPAASLVPTGPTAPPESTPEQVRPAPGAGVCAWWSDLSPRVGVVAAVSPVEGALRASTVDWIVVPPGRAAVVEAVATADSPGSLAIVSDLGVRFPVASREVLAMLGYGSVEPQRLPAAVVALLPAGPALDPAAAVLPF